MGLKIHGLAESTCTGRVLATLYEKGVTDFTLIPVNLMVGEHEQPEFLALQPFGQIPVLEDEEAGLTLFESRAIARYIANKYKDQGTPLYGTTESSRALVEQWLEVEGQNYSPPITAAVMEIVFKPMFGRPSDLAAADVHIEKLSKVLDVYEAHLAKNKYLAGDFFSLADLSHMSYAHCLINVAQKGDVFNSRPHVKAWWEDISSRPAWKQVQELAVRSSMTTIL